MSTLVEKNTFGPWALITGASSGIGREFARQIAASGINTVLVARRQTLLEEVGRENAKAFGVQYRAVVADRRRCASTGSAPQRVLGYYDTRVANSLSIPS